MTPGAGRRLSARSMLMTESNVASQCEVAKKMGQRDEKEPPDPPLPVGFPVAELDDGQVEREHQREELEDLAYGKEEQKKHCTGIVGHPGAGRNLSSTIAGDAHASSRCRPPAGG